MYSHAPIFGNSISQHPRPHCIHHHFFWSKTWQTQAIRFWFSARPGASVAKWRGSGAAGIRGDAMRREDVVAAAAGCDVIVHAVNPPGYRRWSELVLPMIDNTIAAATAVGATVVLPGTIYNYGP